MRVSSRIDGSICGAILHVLYPPLSPLRPSPSLRSSAQSPSSCSSSRLPTASQQPRRCLSLLATRRRPSPLTLSSSSRRRLLLCVQALQTSRLRFDGDPAAVRVNHAAAATVENSGPEPEHEGYAAPEPQPLPSPSSSSPNPSTTTGPAITPQQPQTRKKQKHLKPIRRPLTKEELLALVDPYDDTEEIGRVEDYLQYLRDPYMRGYAEPEQPKVTLARTAEDEEYPSLEQVLEPADEGTRHVLWELRFAVLTRLRSPHKVDLDHIYELYQRLPEPRMLYLHARFRHQLLRALGQPDERDSASMLRYFAVIADVKNTGIPLTTAEWNCAIVFATKYVGRVTDVEVDTALKLWREMELEAGIRATDVTFNILFDVATKAGNFPLAEMIYREMESRGHRYNRYHYTSLIHFFGLKHDTSGMRAAYREMVEAGEIIDTVVLNAMISGLLRSGEEAPAERIYERMKALSLGPSSTNPFSPNSPPILPVRTPLSDRFITQALLMLSKLSRRHPHAQPHLQDMAPLAPDLQTYRILANHYGVKRGDLGRVAAYLDDMKHFHIPLHHSIFLALFKGFARHGGYPRSPWSEQRLEGIWNALLQALDAAQEGEGGIEVRTWLAIWCLRAFAKCAGSRERRVLEVYDVLKARWALSPEEEQFMGDFLSGLVNRGFGK